MWTSMTCLQNLFFSSSSSSDLQTLGLRSSLELRLANHRAIAIVFQLEYVFSAPFGQELMVSVLTEGAQNFILAVNACPSLKLGSGQNVMILKLLTLSNLVKTQNMWHFPTPPSPCPLFVLSPLPHHLYLIVEVPFYLSLDKFPQRKLVQASSVIRSQFTDEA